MPVAWTSSFRINSGSAGLFRGNHVAALPDGGFVAVWAEAGTDAIMARRFDDEGAPVGEQFRVGTALTAAEDDPVVAAHDGGFVVMWVDDASTTERITGQRFDSQGRPVGAEFRVDDAEDFQGAFSVSIATLADGGFVAVWFDRNGGTGGSEVRARIYGPDGDASGEAFQVGLVERAADAEPWVSPLPDGGFVVAHAQDGATVRRFDAEGQPVGQPLSIGGGGWGARVAALADGSVALVWEDWDEGFALTVQVVAADASPGAPLRLSEGPVSDPVLAAVPGGLAVAWLQDERLWLQELDAGGAPLGPVIAVDEGAGRPRDPAVTLLEDGSYVVTWRHDSVAGALHGVFGRRFEPGYDGVSQPEPTPSTDGADWISGTFDDDLIDALDGDDWVWGLGGDDTLVGGPGADVLSGGSGADVHRIVSAAESSPTAFDTLRGFESGVDRLELLDAEAGRLFLMHAGGATYVYFAPGPEGYRGVVYSDRPVHASDLTGGDQGVTIYGDAFSNVLRGGDGADLIVGGDAGDEIVGGLGADVIHGGGAFNTYIYRWVEESTFGGYDVIVGLGRGDSIDIQALEEAGFTNLALARLARSTFVYFGRPGEPAYAGVIQVIGEVQASDLFGASAGVVMYGTGEADALLGHGQDDAILGGGGADLIRGGRGADSLWGGRGADLFHYLSVSDSRTEDGYDVIHDFEVGQDLIDLRSPAQEVIISHFGGSSFIYFDRQNDGRFNSVIVVANTLLTQEDVLVRGEAPSADWPGVAIGAESDPLVLPEEAEAKGVGGEPLVLPAPVSTQSDGHHLGLGRHRPAEAAATVDWLL